MKYIITEMQYQKLLLQEQTSQQSTQTEQPPAQSNWEYGKQMKIFKDDNTTKSNTPTQTKSGNQSFPLYWKNDLKDLAGGPYVVREMKKQTDNTIHVDLTTFKVYTDCTKLQRGDFSLRRVGSGQTYHSKDLARHVGQNFGCKLKE